MRRLLAAMVAALVLAPAGLAAEALSDTNVKGLTLAVNAKGEALVSYARESGQPRHVLVWGAANALAPGADVRQVNFKWDYAGGWKKYRNAKYWKGFRNACKPYDGPAIPYLVAACKAPDGSYWAVQSWQRKLPHRGFEPWLHLQTAYNFDISHWTGEVAKLELAVDWPKTFNYETEQIFGRMTYDGAPVHGFGTTRNGIPTDTYGRGLYIDTLNSAYGEGWKRETSIVFRNPTGSFCYSFWPTNDVSLPGHPSRPAGNGKAYKIEVLGPGVTPNLVATVDDPGAWDPNDEKKVAYENKMKALQLELSQGDKFCPSQT